MKINNVIKLGQVTLNTDDSEVYPKAQVYYNKKVTNALLVQPYGLTSRPPESVSLVMLLSQQGYESNGMGIAFCPSLRKKGLKSGEVVLENMMTQSFMYMKENGDLEVVIAKDISQTSKNINIVGLDTTVSLGDINLTAKSIFVKATTIDLNALVIGLQAGQINMKAKKINVTGAVTVIGDTGIKGNVGILGDVATEGTLTNNGINVGSTHVHGGVQSGGANTSPPS